VKKALDFVLNGAEVVRYHTVHTLQRETVGHHSHGVACLVLMLDEHASRELLMAALMHDLAEQHTGDIPSPAKREYGIGEQVDRLERRLMEEAGLRYPRLAAEDARTLKLADIAHGALFCVREMSLGNRRLRTVYDRYLSYAQQMLLKGVEWDLFHLIGEMRRECE
jgi:5'-deoxynucleotidase YfbR-like HD superfamily hydrolase